jgi:hypothetical protein
MSLKEEAAKVRAECKRRAAEYTAGTHTPEERAEALRRHLATDLLNTLPSNAQVKVLLTIVRDRTTSREDFVFYADRLMRLCASLSFSPATALPLRPDPTPSLLEESLNFVPYTDVVVRTPEGEEYRGVRTAPFSFFRRRSFRRLARDVGNDMRRQRGPRRREHGGCPSCRLPQHEGWQDPHTARRGDRTPQGRALALPAASLI